MAARRQNNVRLGPMPRAHQLALPLGRGFDLARVTAANRATHARAAQAQLRRCELALARQRLAETPPFRRCTVCLGREDVTHPHTHSEAA